MKMTEKSFRFNCLIQKIVFYLFNVEDVRKFSFGTWNNRQHVFVAVKSDKNTGWGENIISVNNPDVSMDAWLSLAENLVGLSLSDGLTEIRNKRGIWDSHYVEMMEMAMYDLAGKEEKCPALSFFSLDEMHSVPGTFVILDNDVSKVSDQIRKAVYRDRAAIVKVKLFGDEELDEAIVNAVRKVAERESTYLIGDANTGYGREGKPVSLAEIASSLHILYDAGLDACEDPAFLPIRGWVELQNMVHPLSLVPDYILRPSCKAVDIIKKGMGDIYNIHPGAAGSIVDAVILARKIKELGAGLMVGDDSLIGPACTVWQQIAMAFDAKWVEAVEKEGDSDFFFSCVLNSNTDSRGPLVTYKHKEDGFGLILDEEELSHFCIKKKEIL